MLHRIAEQSLQSAIGGVCRSDDIAIKTCTGLGVDGQARIINFINPIELTENRTSDVDLLRLTMVLRGNFFPLCREFLAHPDDSLHRRDFSLKYRSGLLA